MSDTTATANTPTAGAPTPAGGGESGGISSVEIELQDVTKRYLAQKTPAVSEVSMSIPAGQITIFVGPSGCGKTTT
ncbi:MAG: ATP-binding cassette domain-containing protein, partial [Sciscionella sp.]